MLKRLLILFGVIITTNLVYASTICLNQNLKSRTLCARQSDADQSCKKNQLAWIKESCIDPDKHQLVPELVENINPSSVILKTDIFRKYTATQIAQSIVYHASLHMDKRELEKPSYDLYSNANLFLQFQTKYLPSIIDRGFLNQFQTGTSQGILTSAGRNMAEEYLSSVIFPGDSNVQEIVNQVRPKYAYVFFEKQDSRIDQNWVEYKYGKIFAKLKDDIKNRTTFSNDDSLDAARGLLRNIKPYDYKHSTLYNSEENLIMKRGSFYEAQIWGPLSYDDVEYLVVDCFTGDSEADETIAILKERKSKVPLYKCIFQQNENNDHFVIRRGQKLYPLND